MLIEPFQRVTPSKFGFAEFGNPAWKCPDPNARQSPRRPARNGNLSRTKWRKYDFQNTKRRFLSIAANLSSIPVIPAQAGIQSPRQICLRPWIPACAGMTAREFWSLHPRRRAIRRTRRRPGTDFAVDFLLAQIPNPWGCQGRAPRAAEGGRLWRSLTAPGIWKTRAPKRSTAKSVPGRAAGGGDA